MEEISNDVSLAARAPAPSRAAFLLLPLSALQNRIKITFTVPKLTLGSSSFFSKLQLREGKAVVVPNSNFGQARCGLGALHLCQHHRAPAWAIPDSDILGEYFMIWVMIWLGNSRRGFFPEICFFSHLFPVYFPFFLVVAGQWGKPVSHYLVVHWPPPGPWSQLGPQAPQQHKY